MRILITGAKGQLGRALVQALPNHDLYPVGAQEMDITQPPSVARVFGEFKPDVVVHAAAWTDTAGCEADPERAMRVNQDGTRHVAEACATCDAAMLYVSTNRIERAIPRPRLTPMPGRNSLESGPFKRFWNTTG